MWNPFSRTRKQNGVKTSFRPRFDVLENRITPVQDIWRGGGGTIFWSTNANWSLGQAPGPDDTAVFNDTSKIGNAFVNCVADPLMAGTTFNSLDMSGYGGTLFLRQSLTFNGGAGSYMYGSRVQTATGLSNKSITFGTRVYISAAVFNSVDVNIPAGAVAGIGSARFVSDWFNNYGTTFFPAATIPGSAIALNSGANIYNGSSGQFNIQAVLVGNNGTISNNVGMMGQFQNNGTITVSSSATVGVPIVNFAGTIQRSRPICARGGTA